MTPELRALFDQPRRLWPGLNVRMQGYGGKKSISGVQVNGANGVLTLARSEHSGLMPSLGTDEEPATLRAGPGVRLHGYGGIHTLERLPVAPPELPPPGPARLEWEVEVFHGYASACTLGESSIDPGNWVISQVTEVNYSLGSYTETLEASGVVASWGPGESPDACDDPIFSTTQDMGFDYGDYVGSDYSETLLPFSTVASAAISAIATDGLTLTATDWTSDLWEDVSTGVIPFSQFFGLVNVDVDASGAAATSYKFRLLNRGSVALRINCGFYGTGLSDVTYDVVLAPRTTSAWFTAPTIDTDTAKYYSASINRVRIGRYRFLA